LRTSKRHFGGHGHRRVVHEDLPTWSIQALQQANSIISKITANLNSHDNLPQQEETNNASNSFGVASYGGRQMHFDVPSGRGPWSLSKISTLDCHIVGAAHSHHEQTSTIIEANLEIDSHANTCCLRANFTSLYFTGKICDVTPFLDTLPSATNIEICTGTMAYDNLNGNTLILIINKALWISNHMQHSLINPYQIRTNGISLCDDPTDTHNFLV